MEARQTETKKYVNHNKILGFVLKLFEMIWLLTACSAAVSCKENSSGSARLWAGLAPDLVMWQTPLIRQKKERRKGRGCQMISSTAVGGKAEEQHKFSNVY